MNKIFSELNKKLQSELKKKESFADGIKSLLLLRQELFNIIESIFTELSKNDFSLLPFPNSKGNDNATIAWSIFHTFRIEDIVCNTLIKNKTQIFFEKDFQRSLNSKIITTGNELTNEQMVDFSKSLDKKELFSYIKAVKENSDGIILKLSFDDLKSKIQEERKINLQKMNVVSSDESAVWLIDYWCKKDVRGLLQMPFSRHWIMHVEACEKIKNKITKMKRRQL